VEIICASGFPGAAGVHENSPAIIKIIKPIRETIRILLSAK